jgi:hypothetical protein
VMLESNSVLFGNFFKLKCKIILQILLAAIIASFKKQAEIFQIQTLVGRIEDSAVRKILKDADFPSQR